MHLNICLECCSWLPVYLGCFFWNRGFLLPKFRFEQATPADTAGVVYKFTFEQSERVFYRRKQRYPLSVLPSSPLYSLSHVSKLASRGDGFTTNAHFKGEVHRVGSGARATVGAGDGDRCAAPPTGALRRWHVRRAAPPTRTPRTPTRRCESFQDGGIDMTQTFLKNQKFWHSLTDHYYAVPLGCRHVRRVYGAAKATPADTAGVVYK